MLRFDGVLARRNMPAQVPLCGVREKPPGDHAAGLISRSSPFGNVLRGLALAIGAGAAFGVSPAFSQCVSTATDLAGAGTCAATGASGDALPNISGNNSMAIGDHAAVTSANSTAIGQNATAGSGSSGNPAEPFDDATAVGTFANAAAFSTAIGAGSTASGGNSVALGRQSTADGANGVAVGAQARASGADGSTAVGQTSIASGFTSTAIGALSVATQSQSTATGHLSAATGTNSSAFGQLSLAGCPGTGFFNLPCAAGVADNTTAIGQASTATANNATALGQASTANAIGATAVGQGTTASGTNSLALGVGASATNNNASAIGEGATTTRDNQVVIGTKTNTYTTPGITSAASSAAQAGPLEIVTTDANGNLAAQAISELPTPCSEPVGGALQCGTNSQATGTQSTALGQNTTASGLGSTAVGFGSVASGAGSTAQGQNSVASGSQSSAFGAGASASGTGSLALGAGSSATAPNSVALGNGSVASLANTVSVGAPGSERRITNVAAGINPTDAVNVSQLNSLSASLGSQIGGLQSQINNNLTEARRGIAAAVATANPPMPSLPGRTTWQLRTGFFEGQTGVGVAFAHRLDTAIPMALMAGYGNGGGIEHTGYVGLMGEF
jgi:hypothetical protein